MQRPKNIILQKLTFMKRKFLAVCVVLALTISTIHAQVSVGLKGGLNVSNLSGVSDLQGFESNALVGFHLGAFTTFNLGRNFAIQPEIMYSTQGAKLEVAGQEENLKNGFINIPVMVRFLTNKGFFLEAGPQIGFRSGDVTWGDEDLTEDFNNTDFSACFGLGFQPMKTPFGIGARYNIGLGKTGELTGQSVNSADLRNGVFQLSLYWRLFGGGKLKK